jgi:glycosyltransferase involved in cell wall biosynthesis
MQRDKKKILMLIDWFAPGYKAGGPIQSCLNLVHALKDDYDIYVLTTDTDHGESQPYNNIRSNEWIDFDASVKIFYAKKKELGFSQIEEQIKKVQADFIYLNHLFSPYFVIYPLWLKFKKKIAGKLILSPRGALYDSALSSKSYKKKPFLFLFKTLGIYKSILFHATTERENRAIQQQFPGANSIISENLPNLDQPVFTSCTKTEDNVKCIFIARIVPIKNLLFALNILQYIKANVQFSIIGPIEDEAYWNECKKKIARLPGNVSVDYHGPKKHDELTTILQQHHLFILPTTGENYGHAIFEALLAGRPVLISDQTPWLDLSASNAGWDLSLNNPAAFTAIIEQVAAWRQHEFDAIALSAWQYAKNNIPARDYKKQYLKLFS